MYLRPVSVAAVNLWNVCKLNWVDIENTQPFNYATYVRVIMEYIVSMSSLTAVYLWLYNYSVVWLIIIPALDEICLITEANMKCERCYFSFFLSYSLLALNHSFSSGLEKLLTKELWWGTATRWVRHQIKVQLNKVWCLQSPQFVIRENVAQICNRITLHCTVAKLLKMMERYQKLSDIINSQLCLLLKLFWYFSCSQ